MQVTQLVLLSRASVLIGTLTSNYLLLAYEMAVHARHALGLPPPPLHDLDGNEYYPCSAKDPAPWGPRYGRKGGPRKP